MNTPERQRIIWDPVDVSSIPPVPINIMSLPKCEGEGERNIEKLATSITVRRRDNRVTSLYLVLSRIQFADVSKCQTPIFGRTNDFIHEVHSAIPSPQRVAFRK